MADFEKIIIVTQKTALEELLERYNTIEQTRFYVEHMGVSISEYLDAHDTYKRALDSLRLKLPSGVRRQEIERGFLPNFLFGEHDLVVALGRDGLVVNTAKYLANQPLLGLNPDTTRNDGVLLPFNVQRADWAFETIFAGTCGMRQVTMAKVELNTGQSMYAVNDLFIGQRTHVSARYRIEQADQGENQSSSGIIVSTGAGSSGWLSSVYNGAFGTMAGIADAPPAENSISSRFDWEAKFLRYAVREPFVSKRSAAKMVFGKADRKNPLRIISEMPQNGVIFSDGIENDSLDFNSGVIATVGIADKCLNLIVPRQNR